MLARSKGESHGARHMSSMWPHMHSGNRGGHFLKLTLSRQTRAPWSDGWFLGWVGKLPG